MFFFIYQEETKKKQALAECLIKGKKKQTRRTSFSKKKQALAKCLIKGKKKRALAECLIEDTSLVN